MARHSMNAGTAAKDCRVNDTWGVPTISAAAGTSSTTPGWHWSPRTTTLTVAAVPGEMSLVKNHEVRRLATLVRSVAVISRGLDASAGLTTFCGLFTETAAGLLRARRAALWHLTADGRLVAEPGAFGFPAERLAALERRVDPQEDGVVTRVLFQDHVYRGTSRDLDHESSGIPVSVPGTTAALVVPWCSGGAVLGCAAAYDAATGFTDADAESLRLLAAVAGVLWHGHQTEAELQHAIALLATTVAERRRVYDELAAMMEQDRRRLAADLHDGVLQQLTAAELSLARLRRRFVGEQALTLLDQVVGLIRGSDEGLRHLVSSLRPPVLDLPGGLDSALRAELEAVVGRNGIAWQLHEGRGAATPVHVAHGAFRIVQEALVNSVKHSAARRVIVTVDRSDGLRLTVRDDGRGFDPSAVRQAGHLGLTLMRERAELLGGTLLVSSHPGRGTAVELHVPRTGASIPG